MPSEQHNLQIEHDSNDICDDPNCDNDQCMIIRLIMTSNMFKKQNDLENENN